MVDFIEPSSVHRQWAENAAQQQQMIALFFENFRRGEVNAQITALTALLKSGVLPETQKQESHRCIADLNAADDADDRVSTFGFCGTEMAVARAAQFASKLQQGSLPAREEKLCAGISAHAQHFPKKAASVMSIGFLFTAGVTLTVLTGGLGAAAGGAMVSEALTRLHELFPSGVSPQHALSTLTAQNKQLAALDFSIVEKNEQALFETWSSNITRHIAAQKAAIPVVLSQLDANDSDHFKLSQGLTDCEKSYDAAIKSLAALAGSNLPLSEKVSQVKSIAIKIISTEASMTPIAEKVASDMPASSVKACITKMVTRAKNFYQENKKMFQVAGLIALMATGIALTVATGGIAAALGVAALSSVAVSPIKSLARRGLEKLSTWFSHDTVVKEAKTLKAHAQAQQDTLSAINADITDPNFHRHFREAIEDYDDTKQQLNALEANPHLPDNNKLMILGSVEDKIEKLDVRSQRHLAEAKKDFSPAMKAKARSFAENAAQFVAKHKTSIRLAAKVALGVGAVAALIVCTGGIGAGVALGFAGLAAAATFISSNLSKIKQKNSVEKVEAKKPSAKIDPEKNQEEGERDSGGSLHH